jgi:hypothetical protein
LIANYGPDYIVVLTSEGGETANGEKVYGKMRLPLKLSDIKKILDDQ